MKDSRTDSVLPWYQPILGRSIKRDCPTTGLGWPWVQGNWGKQRSLTKVWLRRIMLLFDKKRQKVELIFMKLKLRTWRVCVWPFHREHPWDLSNSYEEVCFSAISSFLKQNRVGQFLYCCFICSQESSKVKHCQVLSLS